MKLSKDTYLFKIKQCLLYFYHTKLKKNFEIRLEQKVTIRALNEIKKIGALNLALNRFFLTQLIEIKVYLSIRRRYGEQEKAKNN